MQSIGSQAGFCQKHQMDKIFVGNENATEPTCIRCDADSRPKEGRTVIAEDPGEDFFKGKGTTAKITVLDPSHGGNPGVAEVVKAHVAIAKFGGATLEEIVANAVLNLNGLPMPKDIREFKKIQKVIKTLQTLVENQNG